MELINNVNLNNLSHDLIVAGNEHFYDKILSEDWELQFVVEHAYPVQTPYEHINENSVKRFLNHCLSDRQKRQAQAEFNRAQKLICGNKSQKNVILPNFFLEYLETQTNPLFDYGFNIPYSHGILEKFYSHSHLCLIKPSIDNNLEIFNPETPNEEVTICWSSLDPILNILNMNLEFSNSFLVRSHNSIHFVEIDDEFQLKMKLKLDCDLGYHDVAINFAKKAEIALVNTKYKLDIFNLDKNSVSLSYAMNDLILDSPPRLINCEYLAENLLMVMTDKEINVVDVRCKNASQRIQVILDPCDILLNFTSDKSFDYLSTIYMASKHSYFIFDMRKTSVDDFIHHNLRSPPCFINYFQEIGTELVTLFSQSPNERAIFGKMSPYSLPHHLSSLDDTYIRCMSRSNTPIIPNIKSRLNYPTVGVQIVPNNGDISIYWVNIFGEMFRQDVLLKNFQSDEPIQKMHNWLMEIKGKDNTDLNIVHLGNSNATFDLLTEFSEVDMYNEYEKSKVHQFLEIEDSSRCNQEDFLEIWGEDSIKTLLESETAASKVEDWIENTKFEIDDDVL